MYPLAAARFVLLNTVAAVVEKAAKGSWLMAVFSSLSRSFTSYLLMLSHFKMKQEEHFYINIVLNVLCDQILV